MSGFDPRWIHPDEPVIESVLDLRTFRCPKCRALWIPATTFEKSERTMKRVLDRAEHEVSEILWCGSCLRRRDAGDFNK